MAERADSNVKKAMHLNHFCKLYCFEGIDTFRPLAVATPNLKDVYFVMHFAHFSQPIIYYT